MVVKHGKRMKSGQYFIGVTELAAILGARDIKCGSHGVFVTY